MASQLTDLIRKKYPGQYDDMDDASLEKAVLTKHPEYKDLATSSVNKPPEAQFAGSPHFTPIANSIAKDETTHEPDTYLGGFFKGLKDYGKEITSGVMSGLESAAHPQTAGDFLSLLIPSELPHIARGQLSNIADNIAGKESSALAPKISEAAAPTSNLENVAKSITTQDRPPGPWDSNVSSIVKTPTKASSDTVYDIAREKFNMGRDNPALEEFDPSTLKMSNKVNSHSPTLYHGTQDVFDTFDTSKNKLTSNFPRFNHFSENPARSELYSLGESRGMKREGGLKGNPRTIPAKINSSNILDLTGDTVPPEHLEKLKKIYPELAGTDPIRQVSSGYIKDMINHYPGRKFPFDAIKYKEYGETNWAVHPDTELTSTISGTNLSQSTNKVNSPDEISQLVKDAGLEEPKGPITVIDEQAPDLMDQYQKSVSGPVKAGTPWLDEAGNKIGETTNSAEGSTGLKELQQKRSASMDRRNPGFRGVADDMSTGPNETRGFATKGNEPGINSEAIQSLDKTNQIAKMASPAQKKSLWGEMRDANRAILTSFDLSALARQGKPLMLTKAYWTSIDDMFKSWGSERGYQTVMDSINEHPNFKGVTNPITGKTTKSIAERARLDISGAEQFQSNIAEKLIPGVRPSERAYNGFLNKLRADHFNTMVDDAREMGMNPDQSDIVLKQIGSFINDATGKGSLGKLEKAVPILNEVFFAPKLMASRVNMYKRWLDPRTYGNANPVVRKQAIKSLLATAGFGMATGELARLAGAQISNDPTSSDFRKIKIGNSRVDPFSGFQQYAVGATRLLTGKNTSSTSGKTYDLTSGKFGAPTRASVASQFFSNKLASVPSFVWSWMEGKDWNGQPFEVKKALLDRTVPLVMQDVYDLYKEDPKKFPPGLFRDNPTATKVGLSALPVIGEGMQTYGR